MVAEIKAAEIEAVEATKAEGTRAAEIKVEEIKVEEVTRGSSRAAKAADRQHSSVLMRLLKQLQDGSMKQTCRAKHMPMRFSYSKCRQQKLRGNVSLNVSKPLKNGLWVTSVRTRKKVRVIKGKTLPVVQLMLMPVNSQATVTPTKAKASKSLTSELKVVPVDGDVGTAINVCA